LNVEKIFSKISSWIFFLKAEGQFSRGTGVIHIGKIEVDKILFLRKNLNLMGKKHFDNVFIFKIFFSGKKKKILFFEISSLSQQQNTCPKKLKSLKNSSLYFQSLNQK